MRNLIRSLLVLVTAGVLVSGLQNRLVFAEQGGLPTPSPVSTPRAGSALKPSTLVPIGDNLFILQDGKTGGQFVNQLGTPIPPQFRTPAGNRKRAIPTPMLELGSSQHADTAAVTATGAHSLNIPWSSFIRGTVLLPHDKNSPQGHTIDLASYYTHAAFKWNDSTVFDAVKEGIDVRANTAWPGFELVVDLTYFDDPSLGTSAAERMHDLYNGLPYNILHMCDKFYTQEFYCSQLVWRGYWDKGVDLDTDYFADPPACDVVVPDDIYYSMDLDATWDSTLNMACSDPMFPWKGEYFTNPTLSGAPMYVYCDSAVDFDWGLGPPSPSMGTGDFSVRWTRSMYFGGGLWRFRLAGDDGFRLWVDGNLLIDQWHDQSRTEYEAVVYLTAGNHTIRVEYYDRTWYSNVTLAFEGAYRLNLPLIMRDASAGLVPQSQGTPNPIPYP